jgi:hypothetical protein
MVVLMVTRSYPQLCAAVAATFFLQHPVSAEQPQSEQKIQAAPAPLSDRKPPEYALLPAPNHHVAIPKAALGKEFLLSASVIPQLVAATSTALAGKIVLFELFHDGVDLYESTEGLVVTKDLPARRLLTTFPIIPQADPGLVVIDFNAGMGRVSNDIWYSSSSPDLPKRAPTVSQARSLEIPRSRVFEVRSEGEQLLIRQSAQVRDRQLDPNMEERYEIRYFLTPYSPGDFHTKEHGEDVARYVRFFESHPQIEPTTGRTASKIALFDIRQPLVIHYSANTPAEFVGPIRDGILYWNRAFGREVVHAEKAPEGVTAPDPRYSLIQWVPWDSAGFAYADVIIDPRSGASRQGQTYMTSTFAISGRARARALLRTMQSAAEKTDKGDSPKKEGLKENAGGTSPFFPNARACECDPTAFSKQFAAGLQAALASGKLTDESAQRLSADYVRQVVAHEVGHMLGLRHNFAGSLATTLSHKELGEWFEAYLADDKTQKHADRISSSTVMDYNEIKASAFVGWKIRNTQEVLPYDAAAIRWGYFASNDVVEKKMLFGTDQDIQLYGDVTPFDYGAEPVVAAYASIGDVIRTLPNNLIESFIAAKSPRDPRDRKPLDQLSLFPERAATAVASDYGRLLGWFNAGRRSLKVEQPFPFTGPLNQKELLASHFKSLTDQLEKLGGIDRAAFSFLPVDLKLELKGEPSGADAAEKIDAKKLSERLAKLLEKPEYSHFIGLDEKPAQFTKEEKSLILQRGTAYFEEFQKLVLLQVCQKLERAQRDIGVKALEEVSEDDAVARLEKRIIDLSREIVLSRNEERRHRGKVDKAFVEVADFRYDLETRMAAARMLGESSGSFKSWATDARADQAKQLKEAVDAALNVQNFKEFKESLLSRTLRDWYLNQQNVLGVLGGRGGPMPMPTPPTAKPQGQEP